jgi:hypothetical protein
MVAQFSRKDFLEALFSEYYKEHRGFILVKSFKRGDPKTSNRYFPNIEILAKEHYGEERDVYYGICPRERMKAEKEHVHYLVALWADLDIGPEGHESKDKNKVFEGPQQAAKAIRNFPRAPSIIVESGRGAHLYWLLKQVQEIGDHARVESLLRKISDHLKCDTDVSLDTVLRLPETINTKVPGKPVGCEVKFVNTNFRYSIQDFEDLGRKLILPVTPTASPPSPAPPLAAAASPAPQPTAAVAPRVGPETEIPPLDESLVLDETIIDELIDDMSMTNVLSQAALTEDVQAPTRPAPLQAAPAPSRREPLQRESTGVVHAVAAVTSSILEKMVSSRSEVHISLVGSSTVISGHILWNENGFIGVESDDDLYTIPISSISFIKSKAV